MKMTRGKKREATDENSKPSSTCRQKYSAKKQYSNEEKKRGARTIEHKTGQEKGCEMPR